MKFRIVKRTYSFGENYCIQYFNDLDLRTGIQSGWADYSGTIETLEEARDLKKTFERQYENPLYEVVVE